MWNGRVRPQDKTVFLCVGPAIGERRPSLGKHEVPAHYVQSSAKRLLTANDTDPPLLLVLPAGQGPPKMHTQQNEGAAKEDCLVDTLIADLVYLMSK